MGRVFEALQRQQKRRQKERERDPLAAATGTPDEVAEAEGFEPPSLIGAPSGPRSNAGLIIPALPADDPAADAAHSPASFNSPSSANARSEANSLPVEARHRRQTSSHQPQHQPETMAARRTPEERAQIAQSALRRLQPEQRAESPEPAAQRRQTNAGQSQKEAEAARHPSEKQNAERAIRPSPSAICNLRSVALAPLARARVHPRLIMLTEPQAPECEQYRMLRTQLFHAAERQPAQVITITSALAGEGKTSTALNLALAIAQSKEKRVLIIDGDLRRPNVATYLGLRPRAGLGEALNGDGEAVATMVCLDGEELYVLPVSRAAAHPTELLSRERLSEMLKELRGSFDFILVDSPPVMPFADARLLANHADAVILVVRAGLTPYETVERAVEALPSGRILGVVLNGAEHARETGYYDYYYHYAEREEQRRFSWEKLAPKLRASWLGRRLKL